MGHTDVKYSDPDPAKNQVKAMNDLRSFIGRGQSFEKFLVVATAAVLSGYTMAKFRMICGIAGIEGYPVKALATYISEIVGVDMPTDEVTDEPSTTD